MTTPKKLAAHDKWLCLPCRWTAKLPCVDVRAVDRPSYRCPRCGQRMQWTGTAFRPPRKDDEARWAVVSALLAAGVLFHPSGERRRLPRTQRELARWRASALQSPTWLPERKVSLGPRAPARLVRWGRRTLAHQQPVLVWLEGAWHEGRLVLHGDGFAPLPSPVVRLRATRRSVPLTARSRLRLPAVPDTLG